MAVGLPLKTTYLDGDVYSAADVNDTNGTINLFQTSTLSYQAAKNSVVNGGFDVWQRGTSFSFAASTGYSSATYTADRWQTATGANQAVTVSRQTTADTTNLPNIQYCLRYQRNSGQTGTGALNIGQSFETVASYPFIGKTVTLSFYARKGANYSPTSSLLAVNLWSGTGTDQNVLNGSYTGAVNIISQNATLTTTWQRFTYSGTVGATATELGFYFGMIPTGTAGAADYFEVTGVQLELGSYATTFSRAGGTIQGELAACQRYYQKSYNTDVAPATVTTTGQITNRAYGPENFSYAGNYSFNPTMRGTPTITLYSPNTGTAGKSYNNSSGDVNNAVNSSGMSGFQASINNVSVPNATSNYTHFTAAIEL